MRIFLVLCLILGGCASAAQTPAVVITPPLVFLQEVPEPKLQGKTNADLALFILALQEALRLSNKDKENLRAWVENALLVNSKGND